MRAFEPFAVTPGTTYTGIKGPNLTLDLAANSWKIQRKWKHVDLKLGKESEKTDLRIKGLVCFKSVRLHDSEQRHNSMS